jgi:single-strand DNA-binding protein
MASFNKVLLVGNLTRDPELRYTPKGMAVVSAGLAVNRHWTSESGEKKEEVTFVDFSAWGRTAENLAQYMKKGGAILIEGRLRLEQWDDKQTGQKRQKLTVIAETIQFLGSPQGGGQRSDNDGGTGGRTWDRGQTAKQNAQAGAADDGPPPDDDVPF